ncbi:MAG: FecR domain-containing protein [Halobacteriovoraceae bacterium]|nr:FecR domain-containing protein [Halobacteriovoraceae bacterium]
MAKRLFIVLLSSFLFLSLTAQSDGGVAKLIILKGKVFEYPIEGSPKKLKKGDWVREGSTVKSASRSFVKLLFIDKSQMNIGPNSEMKIKEFPRNKAGIINLIKGKVRAKVTKNYMDIDRKKSKLFIKTKTAAMGVRGTDFQVIYNPKNAVTSLVTFEGAVAMARVDETLKDSGVNQRMLESALNRPEAVVVKQGQYSGALPNQKRVSIPVKISPTQLESLKTGDDGAGRETSENRKPASSTNTNGAKQEKKVVRSIVPKGLDPKLVAEANDSTVEKAMADGMGAGAAEKVVSASTQKIDEIRNEGPPPEGFSDAATGAYAPPAGGYVDDKTGLYVPPSDGSAFDPNAGVYIPAPDVGSVDSETGAYIPPDGFKLIDTGDLVEVEPSREIASIGDGSTQTKGDKSTSDSGKKVNVMNTKALDGKGKEGYGGIGAKYNETDQLAKDLYQETFNNFNNVDQTNVNSGRSQVEFRIRR